MKVIILAAGQGKRLRPLTDECPKAMVHVVGKSILDRQIEQFLRFGITDISVVVGYKSESVRSSYSDLKFYRNDRFDSTNMVTSLLSASPEYNSDIIISYGDILFSSNVLKKVVDSTDEVSVVVDTKWGELYGKRFDNPYDDAESLILNDRIILEIGRKHPLPEQVHAQYTGLIRFSEKALKKMVNLVHDKTGTSEGLGWSDSVEAAYMTDLLQAMVASGETVSAVLIQGEWCEIDSLTDYRIACDMIDSLR